MGYTHYWDQKRSLSWEEWQVAMGDVAAILKLAMERGIRFEVDDGGASPMDDRRINLNGFGPDAHETFEITRARNTKKRHQWDERPSGDFCKTARKPYDIAVCALLCYFSSITETHHVTSDGDGSEWLDALDFAREALPHLSNRLDIPMGVMQADRWCRPWANMFTDQFDFNFCVDGRAYITEAKGSGVYCFPSHEEAKEFYARNKDVLEAWGMFDEKRRKSLRTKQNALFRKMLAVAVTHGRAIPPPAYVRPERARIAA